MSTITYEDLVKKDVNGDKNKNDNYERLQNNIYLNKRESYDDSNKLINSLNEELLSLKRKMKFVYEKDEEIQKLKNKINEYERENANSDSKFKTENTALKLTLSSLEEKNKEYLQRIDELIMDEKLENNNFELYKKENDKLKKDNSLLKRELNLLKRKKSVDNDLDDVTDIDFDVDVKVKEKVKVDIQKLKKILSKKLENKRDNKIEELLKRYNIKDQREIDKNIIEELIRKII
tara:strand:+ start:83 stop:784 length:702 start_codon:yes stop_codon:yes gene_type:complete